MKKRVGIFGFSGCWGEQIVILNCEDELLDLLQFVDLVDFLGGSSVNDEEGSLDIAFVEGSIAGKDQERAIKHVRERTELLVACGSCACFGGPQGMLRERALEEAARLVYGDAAKNLAYGEHHPVAEFVRVDAAIPGCPMEKEEFLRAVASILNGDLPLPETTPVCRECQFQENECLLHKYGIPCLGPVTLGGCKGRCPGYRVPCIGCRGPIEEANYQSWSDILREKGIADSVLLRLPRTFASLERR